MKSPLLFFPILIVLGCSNTNSSYGNEVVKNISVTDDDCSVSQTVPLKSLGNNTFFVERICLSENDDMPSETKYFLAQGNQLELFDVKESQGNAVPKNQAVSLYQSKNHGVTLLSITSWYFCCFPKTEGSLYEIDMYQVTKKDNNYLITKIPANQLGFDNFGLEGNTNDTGEESHYPYKTIDSLKKKLKEINF